MSKKGNKGGRKTAEASTPVKEAVAALSPLQQLIKDVLMGAGAEGLPKDAAWPPSASALASACAAIEALLLKHLALTPKEPDHLQRLALALIMALQSALGVAAATARALVAPSFTLLWDELVKYPLDYGLGDAHAKLAAEADKDKEDAEMTKERDEHYRPPPSAPAELEAWGRAWAFTKVAIAPTANSKA